jgi:hypothetical protein
MKKHFFRAVAVRHVVNRFVFTALIAAAGWGAQAQTAQVKQDITASTASVQYMGSREDISAVAVKYDNSKGGVFTITVRDQEGYLFYQGNFSDKKFSKTFELPRQSFSKLSFVIQHKKTGELQSFELDTRVTEQAVVKRVG